MAIHKDLKLSELHAVDAFQYPTQIAREAAAVTAADIGKVAIQLDNESVWILVSVEPTVWEELTSKVLEGEVVAKTRRIIAGGGLTGDGDLSADRTLAVGSPPDGSIVVEADWVRVGVISNTQHGNRGGGSLHAAATNAVAGFMSAEDKAKLDTVEAGATATPDPTNQTPQNVGASSVVGTSQELARADHVHGHGDQAGGALHAAVTGTEAGFMTPAQKTKLDGIEAGANNTALASVAPGTIGTANVQGTSAAAAREDHSHAHGAQAEPSLHAAATQIASGFMSDTDKAKLDNVAEYATEMYVDNTTTPQPLGFATPGVSVDAAPADHVHAHGQQDGGNLHALVGEGHGFMSKADKTKLDAVDLDTLPTVAEKYALAGTDGTPGFSNPYVTGSDPRLSDSRDPNAHAASHGDGGSDEITIAATQITGLEAALTSKADDSVVVKLSGDQSVAGVKTFSSLPVIPTATPTLPAQAASKSYVDAQMSALSGTYGPAMTDVAALRAVAVASIADMQLRLVESKGAIYRFDSSGTADDDGDATIKPTDAGATGRWFKTQAATQDHETLVNLLGGGSGDHQHLTSTQVGYLPSAEEKQALIGTQNSPDDTNRYVTHADLRLSNARTPTAHETTHLPNGSDPIATGVPVTVGTVNDAGTANSLAKSDHVHSHGNQAGGALHAAATQSVNGFMSASDKTKLDGVTAEATKTPLGSSSPLAVGSASPGTAIVASREDHVHAHGNQAGGSLHSVAGAADGFMSSTDKTKLDQVTIANLPTSSEKSAMAGTSGTPGSLNKFVTDGDSRLSDSRPPLNHAFYHLEGSPDELALAQSQITGLPAALTARALDSTVVHNTGAEAVAGVKTFSSSPAVPTPTQAGEAANKGYVDGKETTLNAAIALKANQSALDTTNSTVSTNDTAAVHKAGVESITGVKTFTASPVVPTPTTDMQASTKKYVDDVATGLDTLIDTKADDAATTAALATKANDVSVVKLSGDQSVAGVKSFSSLPIIPTATPTLDGQAASKKYVDDVDAAQDVVIASKADGAATTSALALKANTTDVNSALALKANDNAVVKLTGAQSVDGVKTFTSLPVIPQTPAAATDAASKGYVDSQVSAVSGSYAAPVADITALKATGTSTPDKQLRLVEASGALFRYDTAATDTADDVNVVTPTGVSGAGRWIKVQAATQAHESLTGLQGGSANDHQHLTTAQVGYLPSATEKANLANMVLTNDARLTNDRTPLHHASTHGSGGDDAITIAESQVTNLVSDLAAKADAASTTSALATKAADNAVVHNTGNESVGGVKTFTSSPVVPTPTTDMQASTKKYADDINSALTSSIATKAADAGVVHNTGAENVAGVKTFSSSPVVPAPTNPTDASTKKYVDDINTALTSSIGTKADASATTAALATKAVDTAVVHNTGNETIGGTKTFSVLPQIPITAPVNNADAASKKYVDDSVAPKANTSDMTTALAAKADSSAMTTALAAKADAAATTSALALKANDNAVVHLTGAESIAGVKTFSSLPSIPQTPSAAGDAASKAYVDQQVSAISGTYAAPVQDITALKATGAATPDKQLRLVEDTGSLFRYDSASTATADDVSVVTPTGVSGAGRWIKIQSATQDHNALLNLNAGTTYQHLTTTEKGYLPTSSEKAALAGTSGVVSGANKFVTDSDGRLTNDRTPLHHASTHNNGGDDAIQLVTAQVTGLDAALTSKADAAATTTALGTKANDSAVVHNTGTETIGGAKTFSVIPTIPSTTPVNATDAASKKYVDDRETAINTAVSAKAADSAVVHNSGNETINGAKTFTTTPTLPVAAPVNSTDAANKKYVDDSVAPKATDSSVVHLAGTETITGAKTFSVLPSIPVTTPTSNDQAASKKYVDDREAALTATITPKAADSAVVHNTGAESVGGLKTFTTIPSIPTTTPTTNDQVASKKYVDDQNTSQSDTLNSAIGLKATDTAVVHNTGAESVAGLKTFSTIPQIPTSTPTLAAEAISKSHLDTQLALKADASTTTAALDTKANDNAVVHLAGAESITGVKTFATGATPVITDQPSSGTQAANKNYVDAQVSAVSGNYAAPVADIAALRAIAYAGIPDRQLRLVEGAGALYRYDTTGTGSDDGDGTILPTGNAGTGRWFKVQAATQSHNALTGLDTGEYLHLSSTEHGNISNWPSATEKAALAGTGTPSGTNKFVTNDDSRLTNSRTPTAHHDSHISGADQIDDATQAVHGLMSAADKIKLDGVAAGATANVGTVTGVTGAAPITSTGGAAPQIGISAATTSAAGSMSAADKAKLDGIASGATANAGTVTSVGSTTPALVVTNPTTTPSLAIANVVAAGNAGLMTGADKTKLDGIAAGATNYSHPTGDGNLHVPATGTTNNGKVLTAGATAGSLSWVTPNAGTVTGVTATAPVVSSGGAAPQISMPSATASRDGYMTLTYASKLDGIQANAQVNDDAAGILTKLLTVDTDTSGLNAQYLGSQLGSYYLNLTNSTGTLPAARFDDTSHGSRGSGTTATPAHAVATTTTPGFLSAADKLKLDGLSAFSGYGGAGANVDNTAATAGVATTLSRSDHTHQVQVGLVANISTIGTKAAGTSALLARADHVHDHGAQGNGNQHTTAQAGIADGFMSAADKTKIDSITVSYIPTTTEKQALVGTSGTPSTSNKYVTDADSRMTNARTPTDHGSSHGSAGLDAIPVNALSIAQTNGLQSALDSKAVDTTVVHNSGSENIGGVKTFTSYPSLPATDPVNPTDAAKKGYVDAQVSAVSGNFASPVADIAALRALAYAGLPDKQIRLVEGAGALYRYDTAGTGADDGDGTILPTGNAGTGRWFKTQSATQSHNSLVPASLQGGTAGQYYHLTSAEYDLRSYWPSAQEHDAFAGTSGTAPSVSNKFVDNADLRLSNARTPTDHGSKHNPGGTDAVATAAPVTIGTANSEGNATSLARSNHVHAHGDQAGGSLHSTATTGAHGFMSSTDKSKLDGIAANATANVGTVTSVSAAAPLTITGTATVNPTVNIPAASSTVDGYLTKGDWATFNDKQNALSPASSSVSGYLTSTDWSAFNGKVSFPGFSASGASTAGKAVEATDSRLSDARVASDVQSWAKALNKPSYNFGEINSGTIGATTGTFSGGVTIQATGLTFGSYTGQMVNLYGTGYGIGIQSSTEYFRSSSAFAWHRGGVHSDTQYDPGAGGALAMKLDASSNLYVTGGIYSGGTAVSLDGHTHTGTYEPVLPAGGTSSHYLRGDKTWQTFPTIPTQTSQLTNNSGFLTAYEDANTVLNKVKTVDGSGSGLDADLLDGMQPATASTANTIAQRDASAQVTAADFIATSDERLKENIESIPDALQKVLALRGVNYSLKADEKHEKKMGVIAQEVEKVCPEVVHTDEKGMKTVSYGSLVGVLIEGMKDQNEIIKKQQAQIDALMAMVEKLTE